MGQPAFNSLLNDPTQQLDEHSEVLAKIMLGTRYRLTTAQREWLDDAALHGNLHDVVERIATEAADERERALRGVGM